MAFSIRFPRRASSQAARNASVTGSRAARSAGNKPPTKPMPSAHFKPLHSSSGETLNWNTTWLKFAPSVADAVAVEDQPGDAAADQAAQQRQQHRLQHHRHHHRHAAEADRAHASRSRARARRRRRTWC